MLTERLVIFNVFWVHFEQLPFLFMQNTVIITQMFDISAIESLLNSRPSISSTYKAVNSTTLPI